jgi:hypothetical protein
MMPLQAGDPPAVLWTPGSGQVCPLCLEVWQTVMFIVLVSAFPCQR